MKSKDKAKPGTNRQGRPHKFEPLLSANASTGGAIAAMARQGAAWHNALEGLRHAPKRTQQTAQGKWWGAAELAQFLGLGGKDVFNRMARGRTPIAPEKAVSYMRELIKKGLLDPHELRAIPRTVGHSRALYPFGPVLAEIRKARYFQVPSKELAERVDQLAEDYRSALSARADAESEDRTALRAARAVAVCALLDLQKVLGREALGSDREIIEAAAAAIEQINDAMNRVAFGVCEVALSPREASILFARQFMAPNGPDGRPDFAGLFRAVTMGAPEVAEARARSIDKLVQRVTDRWGIDPRLACWRAAEPNWRVLDLVVSEPRKPRPKHRIAFTRRPPKALSLRTRRPRVKVTFKYARNAGVPVGGFSSRYSDLTARDLKFMRRITRPGGLHDPRFLLAMAMAEEWYFGDERPECRQSDFESRLDEVREWAVSVLSRGMTSVSQGLEAGGGGDGKVAMLKATEEAAQQRAERDRAEADAKSVRQAAIAEDGELALAFARKRFTLEDLADCGCRLYGWPKWQPGERVEGPLEVTLANLVGAVRMHPDFAGWRAKHVHRQGALLRPTKAPPRRQPDRVIRNCVVEWREYIGSANNLRSVDHRDEGCTVRVYGKKHEIELSDGHQVTKMAGPNLKVIEPARD